LKETIMLIIAALLALFASQSPPTTEPSAAAESPAMEVQIKQEVKPTPLLVELLLPNGSQ
jgi:membrane-bound ClpP family serine protease